MAATAGRRLRPLAPPSSLLLVAFLTRSCPDVAPATCDPAAAARAWCAPAKLTSSPPPPPPRTPAGASVPADLAGALTVRLLSDARAAVKELATDVKTASACRGRCYAVLGAALSACVATEQARARACSRGQPPASRSLQTALRAARPGCRRRP